MTKVAMTAVGGGPAWNSILTGGLVAKTRLHKRIMRILKGKEEKKILIKHKEEQKQIILTHYMSRRQGNLHDD